MIQSAQDESYLVEVSDGVLRLSFNRPGFGNAVPRESVPGLIELFRAAQADPAIRCILMRGNGNVFSAGGDVAGFARSLDQNPIERQEEFGRRIPLLGELVQAVAAFDRPLLASVRGAAAGAGLFYPLIADYAIGDDTANFVFAHQRVGLCPDSGVSFVLPQVVGERMARMLLLTAARLSASEALQLGILHRVVKPDALEDEAMAVAIRFTRAPQTAIRLTKMLVREAPGRPLEEALDAEAGGIVACVAADDFSEGVRAFLEKRAARFPSAV